MPVFNQPIDEWRSRSYKRLPRFVYDYLEGGADAELALMRNVTALERILLLPDRLTDVSQCALSTALLGSEFRYPIVVAPIGLNGLFWADGDIALAKAAAQFHIPFILSTASTSSIEDVGVSTSAPKWFQLYVMADRGACEKLLERAMAAGFGTLVITVDVPVSGNRRRDARHGFGFSLNVSRQMVLDAILHPRWLTQMLRHGFPKLRNFSSTEIAAAVARRTMDKSFAWKDLQWIRRLWRGPIVLKGILNSNDARLASDAGVDGLVVSNHGGRQLDCCPAAVDMLASVVDAAGKLDVLVDGGFRSGSDVVKAIALGAKAVLVGRPVIYGLAANGEYGAAEVLKNLIAEIQVTLALLGINDIRRVTRKHLLPN